MGWIELLFPNTWVWFGFGRVSPYRQLNLTAENRQSPPPVVWNRREVEGDPLIYIVTMLVFFSAGIATLMIIYMKKVRKIVSKIVIYQRK